MDGLDTMSLEAMPKLQCEMDLAKVNQPKIRDSVQKAISSIRLNVVIVDRFGGFALSALRILAQVWPRAEGAGPSLGNVRRLRSSSDGGL